MQDPLIDECLILAYRKIFGSEPRDDIPYWEIIRSLILSLDPRAIGIGMSRRIIYLAAEEVQYPSDEVRREVVGEAERRATEVFDEYDRRGAGAEPHMAEISFYYLNKKGLFEEDIRRHLFDASAA